MADHDDWTVDDDAQLRAALTSLRTDVEAAPLPDVRFVRARGSALRRRRLLTVGAAAAAAVIVAGTVGYAVLDQDGDVVHLPAARTTTSADPSPTTTSSLDTPGVLPLAREWEATLDLPAGSIRLTQAPTLEGGVECADSLGRATLQQSLTQANSPVSAAATYWETGGDKAKAIALEQSVTTCQAGPGFTVRSELVGKYSIYSYGTTDAGSGWFAVVSGGQGVALLQLIDPAFPTVKAGGFTKDELGALAEVARNRLDRYAKSTSSTTTGSSSGPKAINEKMPVTGPAPVPSSDLFIAASQWTDPQFAQGAQASAGQGDQQDSTGDIGVFCESQDFLAGFGGQLGEVEVRAGTGDANVIGHQRVRVDQSADASQAKSAVAAQLGVEKATLVKGCADAGDKVTAKKGPTEGTFLLTKDVTVEATGKQFQWVGITPLSTPGAWTTVVFGGTSDGQGFTGSAAEGFAELDRLLALARQK